MAGKIRSNIVDAQDAIAALTGLKDMSSFKTVDFGDSNVQAMLSGKQLANDLMNDVSKITSCVLTQANKFPELAKQIALRDSQDAKGVALMPKIVREDDNFSSFIWKDLSREALTFVHTHYFSDEMTVDDYIKTYYSNKIRYFKEEADRLFEEAKKTCLVAGTFPEALNDVWTRQVIKKSDSPSENKVKSLFSQTKPKDKNAVERSNLTQKMQQIDNELDDLASLSRNFEENNTEFIRSTQSLLHASNELTNQTAHHDQKEAYQEQATFYELQQTLAYYVNRQNDTLNEKVRIAKINKEDCLEKLYQERNKLAW